MAVLYILPVRIENIRIKRFKQNLALKGIVVNETLNEKVTHIVSALDTIEAVCERFPSSIPEPLRDRLQEICVFVRETWLTDCLKQACVAEVLDEHRIPARNQIEGKKQKKEQRDEEAKISEWACMRDTPLNHHNHHLTDALTVLEQEAQFVGDQNNYSRALAFRRGIAQLATLPRRITRIEDVSKLPNIGTHCKNVIQDILEDGVSREVATIEQSDFYKSMKELTSIFGVGEATAKKWIHTHGVQTVGDAMKHPHIMNTKDERLMHGLAFHEDLDLPVLISEADRFRDLVTAEANAMLPGAIVELTGGFRRGKTSGHDIDLLITHPEEGKEVGLLEKLCKRLKDLDMHLYGKTESSSYSAEKLYNDDGKFNYLKSNLDHFEKFVGILKLDKCNRVAIRDTETKDGGRHKLKQFKDTVVDSSSSYKQCKGTHLGYSSHRQNTINEIDSSKDYEPRAKIFKETVTPKSNTFSSLQEEASLARMWYARRVDLVITPWSQFYYALVGWTGSKFFNRDLRNYAQKVKNMKLTSHGLYDLAKRKIIPATSEREVFENLQVPYREPHLRNG